MAASTIPMMIHRLARAAWLDAVTQVRALGIAVPIAGVMLCSWAIVQEPQFFRRQGQQPAWTFIYALADSWAFLCCVACAPSSDGGLALRLARAVGCATAATGGAALLLGIGLGADVVMRMETPWSLLAELALRYVMLWPAVFLFAQAPFGERVHVARFLAILALLIVQLAIHPLATSSAIVGSDKILASALAAAASLVTITRTTR